MKSPSKNNERIELALEGRLSESEWQSLQEAIVADAELRAAYVDRALVHAQLRAEGNRLLSLLQPTEPLERPVELPPRQEPARQWPAAIMAAIVAASLTAAACWMLMSGSFAPQTVATLVQADNCKWSGSELPTAVDSKLTPGTLALVEGIATLRFESGATVTLEAPTTLVVLDAMHCRLVEGTVTADVPDSAHGFTITTPDIKVVDLGTRFGVTAGSTGNSQVRVFEGEVEIDGLKSGEVKRLTEGNGLHVGSNNVAAGQEPTRGQPVREAGGWTAIPTSFGRGKDAYARRGDQGAPLGLDPLIIVKHSEIEKSANNERRAVVTFDLAQVNTSQATAAELVLDPEPSGYGFAALVPDVSRFAVYGITDESLDGWDEDEMRWATAPGSSDAGPELSRVRRLAEFSIPRGGSGGPLVVQGQGIVEFLHEDTNGLVSFLIVRETGESDHNGVAHGFASKEHPTARPPTLRFK